MRFLSRLSFVTLLTAAVAAPVKADEVTDALDAVRSAYEAGEIGRALEELSFAQSLLQARRADGLSAFLPPAPPGWTREISTEATGAMAFAGGGMAAEGTYSDGSTQITLSMLGDSPMLMAMAPMLANPMMATAAGGKLHRVGDTRVFERENEMLAVVGNRILIRASGDVPGAMLSLIETIDFGALEDFAGP